MFLETKTLSVFLDPSKNSDIDCEEYSSESNIDRGECSPESNIDRGEYSPESDTEDERAIKSRQLLGGLIFEYGFTDAMMDGVISDYALGFAVYK